ncbi:hypothetical protein FQN49_006811 [Arthroderma sp. PD_2]|nr:hypothetical protein FQN49_006811 [Arthroderma sp. PD_2]
MWSALGSLSQPREAVQNAPIARPWRPHKDGLFLRIQEIENEAMDINKPFMNSVGAGMPEEQNNAAARDDFYHLAGNLNDRIAEALQKERSGDRSKRSSIVANLCYSAYCSDGFLRNLEAAINTAPRVIYEGGDPLYIEADDNPSLVLLKQRLPP